MFPREHLSGQDEQRTSELLPLSPKRRDLQKKRPQSPDMGQKCLEGPEDNRSCDVSSVDTTRIKADRAPSVENRTSQRQDDGEVVENAMPRILERVGKDAEKEKMEDEAAEQGSSNIVEHILKELKGINKIQEEISDLRQYLSSVRGSVDEVSCCVDAVLSEIGDLYSGTSAEPLPSPVGQTPRVRQGSLGRQNAITSLQGRDFSPLLYHSEYGKGPERLSPYRIPKHLQDDEATVRSVYRTEQENSNMQMLSLAKPDLCYLELHRGQNYQSTSSLSSCQSSNFHEAGFLSGDTECDRWPSVDIQHSVSGEGGWSEEDFSSCANSRGDLENCQEVWNRCATEETQSSTPGHSSHTSSEHLSLLFGHHYNSPSSSSSMVDWRPLRHQTGEENLECDCAANCPFSRSSGYHTLDAFANDLGSVPSRSLSCSTVLLTDCDDGYLEPRSPCDDCPSSGDTLNLGSAESLDRDWTENSISREDAGNCFSPESSEIDSESIPKTPNVGFDVTTFSKAVVTFRSALKGALRKLEGSNDDENDVSSSPARQSSEPKQSSTENTQEEVSLTDSHLQFASPREGSEASVYVDCSEMHGNMSFSLRASPHKASHRPSTPTECSLAETSQVREVSPLDGELSILGLTPEHSPAAQVDCPLLSTDEVRLSPISENLVLAEENPRKPTDASHRERIANFQRILKEKRRTRHRLSKSAQGSQGSQGSHGSQGSQGSQSQDEFIPEFGREDNQVTHVIPA
ncbi:uncharacterized protein PAE49_000132 [Odontesthes bonariensis]